ncbi:MAG: hypothetical protein JEY94_06190 [Melioribacteraceae bacterium]|nr:hypothetical protein [Melioribacteraceae bacterium]
MQNSQSGNIKSVLQRTVKTLYAVCGEIKSLSEDSEKDFLETGTRLFGISDKANEVADFALQNAELLMGEKTRSIIGDLRTKFKNLESYFVFSMDKVDVDKTLLDKVLEDFDKIKTPFSVFKKIVKHLNLLSVSIRIESARLSVEQQTFEVLANDVYNLATSAEEMLSDIEKLITEIQQRIDRLFIEIDQLRNEEYLTSHKKIQPVKNALNEFWIEQQKYSELNQINSERMKENSDSISSIVVSLQSHDFARQKLEHVSEIIEEQILKLYEEGLKTDVHMATRISILTNMQNDQLLAANNSIQNSVQNVNDGLHTIYQNSVEIKNDSAGLKDNSAGSLNVLSEAGKQIKEISSSLTETAEIHYKVTVDIRETLNLVSKIIVALKKIDKLDETIKVLAFNGLIHASRIGNEGNALRVIADNIQSLSSESQKQVRLFERILSNVAEHANGIKIESDHTDSNSTKNIVSNITNNLSDYFRRLITTNENIEHNTAKYEHTNNEYHKDLIDVIKSISVGDLFESKTNMISKKLENARMNVSPYVDNYLQKEIVDEVKNLDIKFTMDSERQIHEHSLSGSTSKSNVSDDLEDDNIELF